MNDLTTDAVRLCDVMSINEARRLLGLTERQMRWRLDHKQIESVRLSDDLRVVLRASVEAYASAHGNGR